MDLFTSRSRMKFICFFLLMFLALPSDEVFAQHEEPFYKVVLVKGKPLRSGKEALKDGQRMVRKENVMFTTPNDVVILMNARFEKIYLKPRNRTELHRLQKVVDYMPPGRPEDSRSRGQSRGEESQTAFQTVHDTLRINIVSTFKQRVGTKESSYTLLNQFMEPISNSVWLEGEVLCIAPRKPGTFYLNFSTGQNQNKTLAELEFLEKDEVVAELRFVANNTNVPDSSQSYQVRYLRKMYPNISGDDLASVLIRK